LRPDFECLVAALGVAPNITYLTARVVHTTPYQVSDEPTMYLVGCTFTGRVETETHPQEMTAAAV
jgi:hypothetical protein